MNNFWINRPVLVTGAGGFIASHLVEALVERGAKVRAFVRYNSRGDPGLLSMLPVEVIEQTEIISGDLRDFPCMYRAVQDVSHVFHLGALIAIPYSYKNPLEVVETNVIGTLNILDACAKLGVERLVHTSSSEVYGTALTVPIDENHPLQGQSPYSASKIGADKLVESYYRSFDVPAVTLRPFNTYGPRQSTRAVIPTIITQALTQDVINLGNLNTRRDFTYIADTVNGFIQVAETPSVEGETFNLGTGSDVSIEELAQEIIHLIGISKQIRQDSNRLRPENSEVQQLISDNRLAQVCIGWEPKISLKEGLGKTISWISENLSHYKPQKYHV